MIIWPKIFCRPCGCFRFGVTLRARRRLATAVLALGLAASPVAAQQDDDRIGEEDWPCPQSYRPELAATSVWPGAGVVEVTGDWRDDAAIRALAERVARPETSPNKGVGEIDRFVGTLVRNRDQRLVLLFAGVLDEINTYRRFAIDGIWEFMAKRRRLAGVLVEIEAAYLAVPYDGTSKSVSERQRIEERRLRQLRAYDDAGDEARYLCKRLVSLEGKLGTLARTVANHLAP